jgi:predicted Zn-dependent protease
MASRTRRGTIRRMRARTASVLVIAILVAAACQTVPYTGRSQLILLPESTELQMGLQSYQDVLKKSKMSRDTEAIERLQRVGRRIAEATARTDYQWEFHLVEDKQVNAFCLPGGKVAVYTGILPVTQDEAGLAAVVGHEVAHAIARHGAERVSQGLLVQSGLVATQVALSRNDPATVQTVTSLLGAGATVGVILPWSRSQESEADHLGLIYMAKAGYDPTAARDLWVRMQKAGGSRQPEYLSSHPAPATRIAQIEPWLPEALKYYTPR